MKNRAHRVHLVGSDDGVAEFDSEPMFPGHRIAAVVPCLNEAAAVGAVVRGLKRAVPGIQVYVYDNGSTDDTATVAREAGAIVRVEQQPGKGSVVRRAFADIDADVYLLIDGDDTYDPAAAPEMILTLMEGPYDHVLGVRTPDADDAEAYRHGHAWGNRVLNATLAQLFGSNVGDMLSGYRAMSRRFVKSFPALSRGFEIETELTVHCLTQRIPGTSVPVGFQARAEGSESKLHTLRDGRRILGTILNLFRYERPMMFYGALAAALVVGGLLLTGARWLLGGGVDLGASGRAVAGILVVGTVAFGMLCDALTRHRRESSRLAYMHHPAVHGITALPPSLPWLPEDLGTLGTSSMAGVGADSIVSART